MLVLGGMFRIFLVKGAGAGAGVHGWIKSSQ